jgi:hypothetical protein
MRTITSIGIALAGEVMLGSLCHAASENWSPPRTPDGKPVLSGIWSNASVTNLQRPPGQEKLIVTREEAAALVKANPIQRLIDAEDGPSDLQDDLLKDGNTDRGYNAFWIDPGSKLITLNGEKRSSIIVEPKSGKVPPLTPAGQARQMYTLAGYVQADGPERRPLGERCLLSFDSSAGPPMLPLLYNNMYQIVQTKDAVMIHIEMVHDTRIVPLKGKRPAGLRQWMGESTGRWEGDTLVIETTNFRKDQVFRGAAENLKVTERLTRVGPNQIAYRFTIEDPTTFTQPWSGELAFNATHERMHEYACHEGNYALPGILAGAREQERAAAAKK